MTDITKETCIATRKTLQASIGESIEVNGMPLSVTVGNITYSGEEMTVKVVIRAEHYRPKEVRELESMLETYPFFDAEKQDNTGCRLHGYRPRAKKSPWIVKNDAGETFTCNDHFVIRWFWNTAMYKGDDLAAVKMTADKTAFLVRDMDHLSDLYRKWGERNANPPKAGAAKKKSKKKAARKSK